MNERAKNINASRPLFNKDFVLITLSSFIFFYVFHSFILLPIRIEELGGSESSIGFIMGAAAMATILTTPAVGISIDRFGRKWFLASGGLLIALTSLPFAYLNTLTYLFTVLRVFHGAALSLCFVSAGTLIADVSAASKRSQAIGIFGLFSIVNFAIAPFTGKLIVEKWGFHDFFILVCIVGLLAFIAALFIKEPVKLRAKNETGSGFFNVLRRKGVFVSSLTLVMAGSGFVTVITFVPVFALRIGVESYEYFFITYTIAIIGIRVFGGSIPDRYGKKKSSIPALVVFAIGIVAIGFATNQTTLILSGFFFGIGHGLFYPAIYALVIDLCPEIDRGKAVSICSVSFTFGGMLGVFIYGVLAEHAGFRTMFTAAGIVCLLGFIAFMLRGVESTES